MIGWFGTAMLCYLTSKEHLGVRDYTAKHGTAEETAAIAQGLRKKAEEFRKSSGEFGPRRQATMASVDVRGFPGHPVREPDAKTRSV